MRTDKEAGHSLLDQHYDGTTELSDVAGPPVTPGPRFLGPPVPAPPPGAREKPPRFLGPPVTPPAIRK
jgi:hypothetical protein